MMRARRAAIVVSAVSFLGSHATAAAQHAPADPLERRLPDDVSSLDVKVMPTLAARLAIPFGFEEAGALAERVSGSFSPGARSSLPRIVSVRPRPLDVRGLTFRQALDVVVAADRRYEWRDIHGVAVLRPAAAWRDAEHPLLRHPSTVHLQDARVSAAFDSLDVAGETWLDRLNSAARAHGRLQWSLRSEDHTILFDRGRAVTVSEPTVTLADQSGARGFPLSSIR
jgi:hypothetical protein